MNALRFTWWFALISAMLPHDAKALQREWTLGPTPISVIVGEAVGRAPLGRIAGARRLPNGQIVVADASAMELLLFDVRGRFVRVITRRGSGPGEVTNIVSLARSRRAITAIGGLDFVSLSLDGAAPIRYALPNTGGPPSGSIRGVFGDGRLLLGESRVRILSPPSRVVRDTTRLVIASLDDVASRRSLGRFPNHSSLILVVPSAPGGLKFGLLETAPQLEIAVTEQQCWIGDSGGSELLRVDIKSEKGQSIRIPFVARRWNSDTLAQYIRARSTSAASPLEATFVSAWGDREYRSEVVPTFHALHADVSDGVWIEHFRSSLVALPRFTVLSSGGQVVATVTAPRVMRLLDIGEDYVVGAEKDENDVDRIAVYSLRRR